ncbi:MAG: hypothetical protein KDC95_14275, partial [Planctomycetes bacterium]|nr:hypothetical protein [Planctomycetota bacterium]
DHDALLGTSLMSEYVVYTNDDAFGPVRLTYDLEPPKGLELDWHALIAAIRRTDLDANAKTALIDHLDAAGSEWFDSWDSERPIAEDEDDEDLPEVVDAEALRDWILRGELRAVVGDTDIVRRVESALRGSMQLEATGAWRSSASGSTYAHVDTWLSTLEASRVLRTKDRCSVRNWILFEDDVPDCELVVDLPPHASPTQLDELREARLYNEGDLVLRWKPGTALEVVDAARWKEITKPERRELVGWLPPHLPLVDVHGRVYGIVTEYGLTRAPGEAHQGDAWIRNTAAQLKDAWHLDLVRAWFFRYVYDSPDARYAGVLGTDLIYGDIHQTHVETLARSFGGRMSGDCDDLAEVFSELHRAQGGLGHVLSIPGHAAYGFVEKVGRLWYAQALHTYDPVRYRARSPEDALVRLYSFFDPGATIDPAQLSILLRFSGENQRDTWRLGSRIFTDRDYARTMIDVQRDWHLHAFARGAATMQQRIQRDDATIPDRLEYAGLLERQGRWLDAARVLEKILNDFEDPTGEVALRHIAALFEAKRDAEALEATARFRGQGLARILRKGIEGFDTLFQLAFVLLSRDCVDVCFELADEEMSAVRKGILTTPGWLTSGAFDSDMWFESPWHVAIRRAQRNWVTFASRMIERVPETHPAWSDRRTRWTREVESYFEAILPWDLETSSDLVDRMELIGSYRLLTDRARIDGLLDGVNSPDKPYELAEPSERKRRGNLKATFDEDLRWLKVAVNWHIQRFEFALADARRAIRHGGSEEPFALDKLVRRLRLHAARVETSWKTVTAIYPDLDWMRARVEATRYGLAVLEGDTDAQRKTLEVVRDLGDKFTTDSTIEALGVLAPLLDEQRFGRALETYADVLDYRPLWFEIVWAANRAGAHDRALQAAEFACRVHPDDAVFAFERDALRAWTPR